MERGWAETIAHCLKESEVSLIAYVPDVSVVRVTELLESDPFFHVVPATREEEAIGVASGAYAAGRNAAVFMQSSGFGNCSNALASEEPSFRLATVEHGFDTATCRVKHTTKEMKTRCMESIAR